ncbi:hypothetical protein [Williamsia sp.]|uniref:hypothetical protein n=1 Tax=Williamsia sp. TaxID=1872085 RepID=UPI001A1C906E|nr:hypothetical protein [Williamsia sp.]MBJ7290464.1 hypothetical protein [Williamsia sp.]
MTIAAGQSGVKYAIFSLGRLWRRQDCVSVSGHAPESRCGVVASDSATTNRLCLIKDWMFLMSFSRRIAVTAGACVLVGAGAALTAPVASAFTIAPAPGGAKITATQSEARAIHDANLKPALDAALPNFRGERTGKSLGTLVDEYSGKAAVTPGATFYTTVTGIPDRTYIDVGYRSRR